MSDHVLFAILSVWALHIWRASLQHHCTTIAILGKNVHNPPSFIVGSKLWQTSLEFHQGFRWDDQLFSLVSDLIASHTHTHGMRQHAWWMRIWLCFEIVILGNLVWLADELKVKLEQGQRGSFGPRVISEVMSEPSALCFTQCYAWILTRKYS